MGLDAHKKGKGMATSARKENRWKRNVQAANDAESDRRREVEAACMVRGPRPAVVLPLPSSTRRDARNWMRRNAEEFETATELAEAANAALRLPPGAMDDECHWVWEEALSALEWIERPNKE